MCNLHRLLGFNSPLSSPRNRRNANVTNNTYLEEFYCLVSEIEGNIGKLCLECGICFLVLCINACCSDSHKILGVCDRLLKMKKTKINEIKFRILLIYGV